MITDPFMDHTQCVERLWAEYTKHGKLIVAVDFDDTCFDYHLRGTTYPRVIELLRRCERHGFYLVLFTARKEEHIPQAEAFMKDLGVTISSVNCNPFPLPYGNNGKPYYNILLDDRAGLRHAYETLKAVMDRIEGVTASLSTQLV